jgi:esterase/lipase superfamily enzyme
LSYSKTAALGCPSATVFVHGFNTTFAEGLYRQAQMRQDFAMPGVSIHFAWPSRGNVRAYATDRESALIARDDLARLLAAVARTDVSGIVLVGHSMGAQIVAESLRQLAIAGAPRVFGKLEYIVLVAPDIDIDLFRTQIAPVRDKDLPIVVFVSDQDRALRMSSLLRGSGERLGSLRDTAAVAGFPITVVVTSRLQGTDDPRGHFKLATSPAMISLVSGMGRLGVETLSDEARASSLFETSINVLQGVTEVVLDPVPR